MNAKGVTEIKSVSAWRKVSLHSHEEYMEDQKIRMRSQRVQDLCASNVASLARAFEAILVKPSTQQLAHYKSSCLRYNRANSYDIIILYSILNSWKISSCKGQYQHEEKKSTLY